MCGCVTKNSGDETIKAGFMWTMQSQPGIQVVNGPDVADELRNLSCAKRELSFLMEDHDGLPAAVAERAGVRMAWTSSLSVSGPVGYRDACEASWSQSVIERMADLTESPVLVDRCSGFSNARLLVRRPLPHDADGVAFEEWMDFHVNSRH